MNTEMGTVAVYHVNVYLADTVLGAQTVFVDAKRCLFAELGDDTHLYEHLRNESVRLIPWASRDSNVEKPLFPLPNLNFSM